MSDSIASGFQFQPLPDGTVRIEFFDDRKNLVNAQVVTHHAFIMIPLTAFVATTAMDMTEEFSKKLAHIMRAVEEVEDGDE